MSCSSQPTNKLGSAAKAASNEKGFSAKVVHQAQVGTFKPGPEGKVVMAAPSAVSKSNAGTVQNARKVPDVPKAKQETAEKPAKATKVCTTCLSALRMHSGWHVSC